MLKADYFSTSNQSPIKRVFIFLLVMLFTGFIVFSFLIWNQVNQSIKSRISFLNQLLEQNTRDTFKQHESILRVLGGRLLELDVTNRPEKSRDLINNIHNINPGMAGLGVIKKNGQIVLVSGIPKGKKLPNLLNIKQSATSFKKILTSDAIQSGRSYKMKLLNKWLIPIRLRVTNSDNSTAFVLGAGIDIDAANTSWNGILLPEGYKIQLLRPDGYFQYSRPLTSKKSVYPVKANSILFDHVSFLKNKNLKNHHFVLDTRHYYASYIKETDHISLVSVNSKYIYVEFYSQMITPTILLLIFLAGGTLIFILALKDDNRHEATLLKKANFDDLTDLPNRMLAHDRLEMEINHANRNNLQVAVIFFDLDKFKRINDAFGHIVGDKLLKQCADRLELVIRKVDTVARLSGDEFLFILPSQAGMQNIEKIINKIHETMINVFLIDKHEIHMNCSMGISIYPDDANDAEKLVMAADTALYKAKESGRRRHCFYSSKMNDDMQRKIKLDNELRHALENNELYLVYQPKFDIATMKCIGAEALLRWNNKNLGEINPVEFIPIAEDSGVIIELGDFVIEQACKDLKLCLTQTKNDFTLAINISPIQLQKKDFVNSLSEHIDSHDIDTSHFELEITESTLIDNPSELNLLAAAKYNIAIDDFGTGFSSLSYLSKFPISTLKIDRAFVNDISKTKNDAKLVIAIINMAKSLELNVVAEGIETKQQLDFLNAADCQYGQGYYYSKPILIDEFKKKHL